jgi:hypothetical protein
MRSRPVLVRPVRLDPSGRAGPTRGQARGPLWRSTGHGWYVPAGVTLSPEQRILEAAVRLPPGGAVTGWAALRLLGAEDADGLAPDGRTELPVPLCTGRRRNIRPDRRVLVLRDPLGADDVVIRHGVACTLPERAAFDAARLAPDGREAVVALDVALAADLTSARRLHAHVTALAGRRGARVVRDALRLARERTWSPLETRVRLVWLLDAGLPDPLVNVPVFTPGGRLLGYPDLLDPATGLVGEVDGAVHRSARRHSSDVRREDLMRRAGLEVFRVTGSDLARRDLLSARMRAAADRAAVTRARHWTLEPPPDWDPGPSLDARLVLRDALRTTEP